MINIVGTLSSAHSLKLSPCCHSPILLPGALSLKVQMWCLTGTGQTFAARKPSSDLGLVRVFR